MIKELDDYVDKVKEKYPSVPRDELYSILQHGFVKLFELNRFGSDVQIENHRYSAYFGHQQVDSLSKAKYQHQIKCKKLRLQHSYTLKDFDGKYYCGLTEEQYEIYKKQRSYKKFKSEGLKFYKIKDECFMYKKYKYFFILYFPVDLGWTFEKDSVNKENFEYFAYRDEKNKIIEING